MSLLSTSDQQQLREQFAALTRPVHIVFFSQAIGCDTCAETQQILREITDLTDRVTVEELSLVLEKDRAAAYGIDRVPALVLLAGEEKEDTRIRFLGAPEGWDFLSLVDAVLLAGGGSSQSLSSETVDRLGQLTDDIAIHVFVTPTWPHCPRAVGLANRMALASARVTSTTVQATEFYDLARQYRVTGVPKTVASNGAEVLGALPEKQFVEGLLEAGE